MTPDELSARINRITRDVNTLRDALRNAGINADGEVLLILASLRRISIAVRGGTRPAGPPWGGAA